MFQVGDYAFVKNNANFIPSTLIQIEEVYPDKQMYRVRQVASGKTFLASADVLVAGTIGGQRKINLVTTYWEENKERLL